MRFIFLIVFFVLLVSWVLSFVVFHVAGGLIHILLIIAVIALIMHFVRGSSAALPGVSFSALGKPDLITPDATGVMNVYLNTTK